MSEQQFNDDINWILMLYEKTELTWEDKVKRWLHGRVMWASKAHRDNSELSAVQCWRKGREMEQEVIHMYQVYGMFLLQVQHDMRARARQA